jgi:hypothetical protein
MATDAIEREEWLLLLGMIADLRAELHRIVERLAGDDPGEDEGDEDV